MMGYNLIKTICVLLAALVLSTTVSAETDLDLTFTDNTYGSRQDILLAAADMGPSEDQSDESAMDSTGEPAISAHCLKLRADIDADLGEVLKAGCQPTLAQMSALMDNPLGNVAMLFNQYDSYTMEHGTYGDEAVQGNYMLLFQFPKKLNENWNLINRVVLNVASAPLDVDKIGDPNYGTAPGGGPLASSQIPALPIDIFEGRTTGLGDTYYVGLFAPNVPKTLANGAKFLWGAGFDLGFDTAEEDILGTGKYLAGPSALAVYMGKKWKFGGLVQHYEDIGGDDDRDDVSMTNIQAIYYYSISETASIGAGPNIIANWEQDNDNTWTVPIGIGINKTFQFGKVPVRIGFEAMYSVVQPDDVVGAKWNFRLFVIPAVPSALFGWMQ
jgi:hypothetical protein